MSRFLKKLFKFTIPFVLMLLSSIGLIELLLANIDSTFKLKARSFSKQIDNVQLVVLGSSHNQSAVNPEYIDSFNSINLAFGGQDPSIDSAILNKCINYLPKLKIVVFDFYYHSLEHRNTSNYFRNSSYLRFYGLNLFDRDLSLADYSIFLSNPSFYLNTLSPFTSNNSYNKYGFTIGLADDNLSTYKFLHLGFDESAIRADQSNYHVQRHNNENILSFMKNSSTYEEMVKKCLDNDVIPIFVSSPVYSTYYNSYILEKDNRRKKLINDFIKKYPECVFWNYENDRRFTIRDFKDDDHLNPEGARKFSIILDKQLKDFIRNLE